MGISSRLPLNDPNKASLNVKSLGRASGRLVLLLFVIVGRGTSQTIVLLVLRVLRRFIYGDGFTGSSTLFDVSLCLA